MQIEQSIGRVFNLLGKKIETVLTAQYLDVILLFQMKGSMREGEFLEIRYSKQALKFLKKQDRSTQKRIITAINDLPSGDVKALKGKNGYRLRIGDYRVIFDKSGNILLIEKIDNRGQVYKGV